MVERQLTIKFVGRDQGLNRTASTAKIELQGLGSETRKASSASEGLAQSLGTSDAALGSFAQKTAATTVVLEKSVEVLGQFAGAAASGVRNAVNTFVDFDRTIVQAGVVSGASAEQLGMLRSEVQRLGVETSKTPAEIGATSVALSRAGFTADETSVALEGVARASEATGESLELVGDITAKTVRTFGLAASQSGQVGDILVATANNTNTTVNSIGESLSFVGSVAAAADQPLEDIAIAIGLLGDAGIQGSSAGTNLASALEALKQASAGVESEFTGLVRGNAKRVEAFELINTSVRNADGSMKSIIDIIPIIQQNLDGLSRGDQDVIFRALFGTQGGRAIQTLLNATDERVQEVTESIRNSGGAAEEAGEAMLNGLGGALDLIEGSLGAVGARVGSFIAVGLEPLVRGATAVLNGFLALPAPIQAVIVGIGGFGAALAGAVALLTTMQALQINITATTIKQTAAQIANNTQLVISNAAKLASIAREQALILVKKASVATEVALNTVRQAAIALSNRENVVLALNVAATKAAALAKQGYAAAATGANIVTGQLLGNFGKLAVKGALVGAAIFAVSEAFRRSEGAKFASDLREALAEFEKLEGAAMRSEESLGGASRALSRYQQVLAERGPIELFRTAMLDVQSAVLGTSDSTDRLGSQLQVLGLNVGFVTAQQKGAQDAALATAETVDRLGLAVDETTRLIDQYGQAGEGTQLPTDQVAEFTSAVSDQAAQLQRQIEFLEEEKGLGAENDAVLDREIQLRKQIIATLEEKVAAQNGDISAVENAVRATQELSTVLDELSDKYDRLESTANLETTEALANIAQRQADGIIGAQEAEQERLNVEQEALSEQLQRDRELLDELLAQRGTREGEEAVQLDDEILDQQTRVAEGEKQLAEERIKQQEELTETVEGEEQKRIDALKEAEEEKLKAIEEAAQEAIDAAVEAEQERNIKLAELRRDGQITETEANAASAEAATERTRKELEAEQKKLRDINRLETLSAAEIAQQRQQVNALTLDLIESEIAAEEALREVIVERIEEQLQAIRNAAQAEVQALTQVQNALEGINQSFERQNNLLDVRRGALQAQENALQGAFDIAIDLAANDRERERLQRAAADARVAAAERSAAIEERILQLQIQQQLVQNEIEQSRTRADLAQQQVSTAEAVANLENLRQNPQATQGQLDAAEAAIAASQQAEVALGQQLVGLEQFSRDIQELGELQLAATRAEGQESILQARRDRLDVLPEGRERDREAASIRSDANALIRSQTAAIDQNFGSLIRNFDQRLAENTSAFQQVRDQISRDTQLTSDRSLIQTQSLTAEQLTTVAPQQTGVLQALEEGFAKIAADTRENGPVMIEQNNSLSVDARDTQPRDVSQELLNELDAVLTEAGRRVQ